MSFAFSFSNSSCVKFGLIAASAINSNILGKYFDKLLANALVAPIFNVAPRKSTSSLKSSFDIDLEPLPIRLPVKL